MAIDSADQTECVGSKPGSSYVWVTGPLRAPSLLALSTSKGGFPGDLDGKESTCQCRRHGLDSWVRKISWRRKGLPIPVFLPGKPHGERSLAGYRPWGHKGSDMTYQLSMHARTHFWTERYVQCTYLLLKWNSPLKKYDPCTWSTHRAFLCLCLKYEWRAKIIRHERKYSDIKDRNQMKPTKKGI